MLSGQTLSALDALLVSLSGMAIVMLELVLIALMIMLMAKIVGGKKPQTASSIALPAAAPVAPAAVEDEEEMHAVVMAVISQELQVPPDQLYFKSIR